MSVIVVEREMPIAVGITPRRSNVCGVHDIRVHEHNLERVSFGFVTLSNDEGAYILLDLLKELAVALLDVLTPKALAFE